MIMIMLMISMILALAFMLLFINIIISKKLHASREKTSPFECGFDPIASNHMPFSIHFFMISLIFLIFDIEITILIPLVHLFTYMNLFMIFTSFIFLLILLISVYIEYMEQSIDWKL